MIDRLGLVGAGVEGGGDDQRVDPGGLGNLGVADDAVSGRIDDTGEEGTRPFVTLTACSTIALRAASSWNTTSLVEPSTNRPSTPLRSNVRGRG
jgi:hypothetical protein